MKRLMIATALAVVTAGTTGCECTRCCQRGCAAPTPGCSTCGGAPAPFYGGTTGPYLNSAPMQPASPTPEVYTPAPVTQ